ncbi:hypothetical protein CJI59_38105, partial [Streptomyces sp. Alain-F2R5]
YQIEHQSTHGFCMWAAELSSSGAFVGAVGLLVVNFPAHFTPAVEVGWRLAREFWEQGLATEAGRKTLEFWLPGTGVVRDCRACERSQHALSSGHVEIGDDTQRS